jgi:uncharacterized protein YndB with AHSA1/START domain
MQVSDVITREMVLGAKRSEVWAALTTPEGLAGWWCKSASIDLQPGGEIAFNMGEQYGVHPARVEAVEAEELFAFSWRPFQSEEGAEELPHLSTRVEFRLEDHPRGTLLHLRETGFEALPGALAAKTLHENEAGWDEQLANLRSYIVTGHPVSRP